jgi:hypothetical protein
MRKVVMFMLLIFHYSLFIFHCLLTATQNKIEVNERKYPAGKAKGRAKKYTEYE